MGDPQRSTLWTRAKVPTVPWQLGLGRVKVDPQMRGVGLAQDGHRTEGHQDGTRAEAQKSANLDHRIGDLAVRVDLQRTDRSDYLILQAIDGCTFDIGRRQFMNFGLLISIALEDMRARTFALVWHVCRRCHDVLLDPEDGDLWQQVPPAGSCPAALSWPDRARRGSRAR